MGILVALMIELVMVLLVLALLAAAIIAVVRFLLGGKGMDEGVEEYRGTPGAVLLDVRTAGEYRSGHVEGSVNIPLDEIEKAAERYPDMNTPFFVHCRSGARSGMAVSKLKKMGYSRVKNIGGIAGYKGKVVEGE